MDVKGGWIMSWFRRKTVIAEIDYEKLKEIIVLANQETARQEDKRKKEQYESDNATTTLVGFINFAFGAISLVLFAVIVAAVVLSRDIAHGIGLQQRFNIFLCLFFGCMLICIILFVFVKKRGRARDILSYAFFITFIGAFVVGGLTVEISSELAAYWFVAGAAGVLLLIIATLYTALKHEYDRNYIVAYFSALVSLAALFATAGPLIAKLL